MYRFTVLLGLSSCTAMPLQLDGSIAIAAAAPGIPWVQLLAVCAGAVMVILLFAHPSIPSRTFVTKQRFTGRRRIPQAHVVETMRWR